MKSLILTVLFTAVLLTGAGSANGDIIGLYSDAAGTDCDIADVPGLIEIYIVHYSVDGATGSRFAAPLPACALSWVYIATDYPGICPILGCPNPLEGDIFLYPECYSGAILVCKMSFLGFGQVEACCVYPVIPDPEADSNQIEFYDCNATPGTLTNETSVINGGSLCPCLHIVPTESSTWGRIKSLYRL